MAYYSQSYTATRLLQDYLGKCCLTSRPQQGFLRYLLKSTNPEFFCLLFLPFTSSFSFLSSQTHLLQTVSFHCISTFYFISTTHKHLDQTRKKSTYLTDHGCYIIRLPSSSSSTTEQASQIIYLISILLSYALQSNEHLHRKYQTNQKHIVIQSIISSLTTDARSRLAANTKCYHQLHSAQSQHSHDIGPRPSATCIILYHQTKQHS